MITIDGKQVKLQIWDTVSTDIGEGRAGRAKYSLYRINLDQDFY